MEANAPLIFSQELKDKACHKIFESLFRFVAHEKPIYNREQKSNTYKAANRLSTCASVLRTAVDTLVRNLRTKSVRAVIDHIIDTLPIPGEGLWEPLSLDYTKCLTSLLRHPPHVEHLGDAEWGKLIEFCVTAINLRRSDESQLSIRSGHRSVPEDALDNSDGRSTPARITAAPVGREKYVGDKNAVGELVFCIQLLTASPSAPVQASAESILSGLAEFVKSPSIMAGSAHQIAFSSINTVVSKVLFNQSDLIRPYLLNMVPVIRRLWTTKLHNLKDELLVTLMLCTVILTDDAEGQSEATENSVAGLTETLQMDYARRPEKELLQIDEVVFHAGTSHKFRPLYGPRFGVPRSEHAWTVIWVIANLLKLSDSMIKRSSSVDPIPETPSKRQRLTSAIDDILRDAISAIGTRRICALQLIPLLEHAIDSGMKESLVQRLVPNIVDDNNAVSSWTMVALIRFVISKPS